MHASIFQRTSSGIKSIGGIICRPPAEYAVPSRQRNVEDVFVLHDPGDCPLRPGMRMNLIEVDAMLRMKSFNMYTHLVRRQCPRYGYVALKPSGRHQYIVWVTHKEQLRTLHDIQLELGIG